MNNLLTLPGLTPSAELRKQAAVFSSTLQRELDVPFWCYDAQTGERIQLTEKPGVVPMAALAPSTILRLASEGQSQVMRVNNHRYRITAVLCDEARALVVAVGEMAALAADPADQDKEQHRLEQWTRSVLERFRFQQEFQNWRNRQTGQEEQISQLWETLFRLNHLTRRVRAHKEPEKNRHRILEAALSTLQVESLLWVPEEGSGTISVWGEPLATPQEIRLILRQLETAGALNGEELLANQELASVWKNEVPQVRNLLALQVMGRESHGWVLALNRKGDRPTSAPAGFRRRDAALLGPFVSLLELQEKSCRRYQDLQGLLVGLTRSLTSAIDAKDSYTVGHSERVARISVEIAKELGLSADELSDVYLAGLLHDIGKIGIRDNLLTKAVKLTSEEFRHVQQHVVIGYRILADLGPIRRLLSGVLHHHEHYDGSGYPNGLAGKNIPLLARILAVADAYDAMTTRRAYREARSYREAEDIIFKGAGTQWDPEVTEAFRRCRSRIYVIRQRGVGESLRHAFDGALGIEESLRDLPEL